MVKPLLKWAGGKRQIVRTLIQMVPGSFERYFEPFFGGGAFFFSLYDQQLLNDSVISDINHDLCTLYKVVKEQPEDLVSLIESLEFANNPSSYYLARKKFNSIDSVNEPVEKAALLIYLNRHCFNGLYRVNSKGIFNVPFGKYANPHLPGRDHIISVSESLRNAKIMQQDFRDVAEQAEPGDFVYFDPPYDPVSSTSYFTCYSHESFGSADQANLASVAGILDRKNVHFMISNSDTSLIRELYSNYHITMISANRPINSKASGRGKINELIITNY